MVPHWEVHSGYSATQITKMYKILKKPKPHPHLDEPKSPERPKGGSRPGPSKSPSPKKMAKNA